MNKMEKRILKIYTSSNCKKDNPKPCITLQGDWIEELGYSIGKKIIVEPKNENDKIIIVLKLIDE